MMQNKNFLEEIKFQIRHGKMTNKLIIINVGVFVLIQLLMATQRLTETPNDFLINNVFGLDTHLSGFLRRPWGLITSIFSHFDLWHLLFNMLFLYFAGKFFETIFDQKRLLATYLIGGIIGGLVELLAHLIFFNNSSNSPFVVGASGSIMAIFAAIAFYSPNTKVMLFGVLPIRLFILAIFFLLKDIIGIGQEDGIAHFAHIGGAILGVLSVQKTYSKRNIITFTLNIFNNLSTFNFSANKKTSKTFRAKSDEAYNYEKKIKQEKTDVILDKIAKSGYESLNKSEKDFLFNQSNK
jgi:membrane associated rhomboid family serine protease